MKWFMLSLLIAALILPGLSHPTVAGPRLSARAAALVDVATGRILYEVNGRLRAYPASTTKVLTGLLALELGDPQSEVEISQRAAGVEGSSIYLARGERLSLESLVYGLLLSSGNDAAVAIAEFIGGSVEEFANLMNQRARQLGATGSHFTNPHGLPDDNHYTTARDLALISAAAMRNPAFRTIASTKRKVIPWPGRDWDRALYNHNRLLWAYDGCDGVKTGYTRAAGRCLVASASRNGLSLVAVVLDAPNMWEDATRLLDYGFQRYRNYEVVRGGSYLRTVAVHDGSPGRVGLVAADGFSLAVTDQELSRIHTQLEAEGTYRAPLEKGEVLGHLRVFLDGSEIGRVDLVAAERVQRVRLVPALFRRVYELFILLWQGGE